MRSIATTRTAARRPRPLDATGSTPSSTGRVTATAVLEPGQKLRLIKFVALRLVRQPLACPRCATRSTPRCPPPSTGGWDSLVAEQRDCLDVFWRAADVEIEGDPEIQQAVRFALFQVLQSAARAESAPIPAKGLTGTGYDGHAFWDTETFVLPVLTYIDSSSVAHALRWRHSTLPDARDRAAQLGLDGRHLPLAHDHGRRMLRRTGRPAPPPSTSTPTSPTRSSATCATTGDIEFEREVGIELLVETARLWRSLGHLDGNGRFRIDGVTGPDEYSALADNNVYTNLMAQRNLLAAADNALRHRKEATALGVTRPRSTSWRRGGRGGVRALRRELGVHPQSDGFTDRRALGLRAHHRRTTTRCCCTTRTSSSTASRSSSRPTWCWQCTCRCDAFTPEQKAAQLRLLRAADRPRLLALRLHPGRDRGRGRPSGAGLRLPGRGSADGPRRPRAQHGDGLHLASLAGAWIALVAGFGGMRHTDFGLCFSPRLPKGWARLSFGLALGEGTLRVDVRPDKVAYSYTGKEPCELVHAGQSVRLEPGSPMILPVKAPTERPAPAQPPGREPTRRTSSARRANGPGSSVQR